MPADLDTIKLEVAAAAELASSLARVLPQYARFIAVGKVLALAFPDIYTDIQRWIEGQPATQAEIDDLAKKVEALARPETII